MNYLGLDCVMMIIIKLLLKCSELFLKMMGNWSSLRKGACTFQKFWNFWDGACYVRYF